MVKEELMSDADLIAQEDYRPFEVMLLTAIDADNETQGLKKYLGKPARQYRNAYLNGYFKTR